MPICKPTLCFQWPVHHIAPNVEQGRLLILTREEVVERIVRAVGPIVEPVTHGLGLRYASYIHRQPWYLRGNALGSGPPCLGNKTSISVSYHAVSQFRRPIQREPSAGELKAARRKTCPWEPNKKAPRYRRVRREEKGSSTHSSPDLEPHCTSH